ncbi:MAG: LysR family transcriptional regulator, partial [Bdellovibrionia bacterium]
MINDLKDIRHLDSSLFKAFMAAARELNFTSAALKAAMTQSGVSQQIAKLEEQVGAPLFERVNKKVHLTNAGRLLSELVEQHFDQTEKFLEQVSLQTRELRGPVRYAMPHSCLFT